MKFLSVEISADICNMDKLILGAVRNPYFDCADVLQLFLIGYKANDNHKVSSDPHEE
jgi:hypothetical protein